MSEKLEIDQDKIVHEDQYKMNLDLEIPETKEAIPSTQMNTEEKQEIITEQIIENKPKAVNVNYF